MQQLRGDLAGGVRAILFSLNRALQLDGCLRSLAGHVLDPALPAVVWKASDARHEAAYLQLQALHPEVTWLREGDFEMDVRSLLTGEHVLLAVDDTIFVRPFSPAECAKQLDLYSGTLGVSLRLGCNTTHCYPINRAQRLPPIDKAEAGIIEWRWPGADGDFGYPWEVSSSIYRTEDVATVLRGVRFHNPNEMEHVMATRAKRYAIAHPWLMSYETSVALSNPCNIVQSTYRNRSREDPACDAATLLGWWEQGYRMRIETYAGFTSESAHQELPIYLERRP